MDVNILKIEKPIWFMRQAGRHLPEYMKLRSKKEGFLDFCFDFNSIVESTLQPVQRYDIDCAIVFSDILVIPHILSQEVVFKKGVGPELENLYLERLIELEVDSSKFRDLKESYSAIKSIRSLLNKNKSLIGFCGAPWTVACYMIDGNSRNGFELSQQSIKNNKEKLILLLDKIVNVSINHLANQYESGCDTLMIFESWAGLVNAKSKKDILYKPVKKIIDGLRRKNINAPIIVFPKGLGTSIIEYIQNVNVDILSIDYDTNLAWALNNIGKNIVLQGNLDPRILLEGGIELEKHSKNIKKVVGERQHIFNVGHGLLPKTPIENVKKFIQIIRGK